MVKNRKKRGFKEVLSKCLDCGNRFSVDDKECDECGSKNIRQGGWFKVNKAKKQLTEELMNEALYGYEVKMIITSNPTSKPNPFYKKWLESINQREVKWFISENALKEWEDTDESK